MKEKIPLTIKICFRIFTGNFFHLYISSYDILCFVPSFRKAQLDVRREAGDIRKERRSREGRERTLPPRAHQKDYWKELSSERSLERTLIRKIIRKNSHQKEHQEDHQKEHLLIHFGDEEFEIWVLFEEGR